MIAVQAAAETNVEKSLIENIRTRRIASGCFYFMYEMDVYVYSELFSEHGQISQ